jgi:gliding motility-associated-like protein
VRSQITAIGDCNAAPVSATPTDLLDSIFVYQSGAGGTLIATPPSGLGPWDFEWQVFVPGFNGWTSYASEYDVNSSTIAGLASGGYRVTITDANGTPVGCYIAWISEIVGSPGGVDILPIPPSCTSINLVGVITPTVITPIYEVGPPPIIVDANTQISICFTGNHTWVSDLAFYLVGPPSCGSPTVLLSPNPGAIGQGPVCNSGNNVSNLCFSTESTNNLNICTASTPLSGTYGTYGPSNTPINWNPIFGCDATAGGWAVQIYDCIGLDVGALTDATLTFTGNNECGVSQTIVYSTPPGFSSPINDNSCSSSTASIFQVTSSTADPIPQGDCWYEWNADPWVLIPDSTSSLNIILDAPNDSTIFSLDYMCDFDGDGIADMVVEGGDQGCGGSSGATEPFNPIIPVAPVLGGATSVCQGTEAFYMSSSIPDGVWSGTGITADGYFSPFMALGSTVLTFTPNNPCNPPASITVEVSPIVNDIWYNDIGEICQQADPIDIGYCDPFMGWCWPIDAGVPGAYLDYNTVMFDPAVAGPGTYSWTEYYSSSCVNGEVINEITVIEQPQPVISAPDSVCEFADAISLDVSITGGSWSGAGIIDISTGQFQPNNSMGGTYVPVSYTIGGICPSTANAIINVIDAPEPVIYPVDSLCVGQDPVFLSSNFPGGIWSGSGIVDEIAGEFDPGIAGEGTPVIQYTVDNGCYVQTDLTVPVAANLDATILAAGPFCITETEIELTAVDPGGSWSGSGISDSVNGVFDPSLAGIGESEVVYSIGGVCGDSQTILITVEGLPSLDISDPGQQCENGPNIDLSTNVSAGIWSGTGVDFNGEFSPAEAGVGLWDITYSYDGVCNVDTTFQVEVVPAPQVDVPDEITICEGDSVMVTGVGTFDSLVWDGQDEGDSVWLFDEGVYVVNATLGSCSESFQTQLNVILIPEVDLGEDVVLCEGQNVLFDAGLPGIWSNGDVGESTSADENAVISFVYPNNGCPAYDTVVVQVLTYPQIDLGPDRYICPDATATLFANMSGLWSTGDTLSSIVVDDPGVYVFSSANGECVSTDSIWVYILPLPVADLGEDLVGCVDEPLVLYAGHPANNSYEWTTGEEGDWIYVSNNGVYGVYTSNTCGETYDEIEVSFIDCTPSVYIPNAFTPDGDGVNDVWRPETYLLTSYELFVYDRWGTRLFYSTNPEEYWTGNVDGGDYFVQDGVYVYLLKYATDDLDAQRIRGHVVVLR